MAVEDIDERFIFQGVHMLFSCEPRLNRLIFIGQDLDREALQKGFKSCLVKTELATSEKGTQIP